MPLIEKGGVGGGRSPPTASRPPRSKEKDLEKKSAAQIAAQQ